MNLIGILLALLLERLLSRLPGWGHPVLFLMLSRTLMRLLRWRALWRSSVAPYVLLAPPLAMVAAVSHAIEHPLLSLLWSSLVLLLCLGPRDLAEDVKQLMAARERGDTETAARLAAALQRGPQPDATHRSLLGALFIQSHERLFGVLLWFFAFGPVGALFYRAVTRLPRLLREKVPGTAAVSMAELLHDLAAWVPARIAALLFGLAGSLDDAMQVWRQLLADPHPSWRSQTWAVLAEVSAASLRMEDASGSVVVPASLEVSLNEVLRMQLRALIVLLAFFAFFATGSMF